MNSLFDEESEIGDWVNYKFTFTRSDKVACKAVSELSWLAAYEAMFLDPVGVYSIIFWVPSVYVSGRETF